MWGLRARKAEAAGKGRFLSSILKDVRLVEGFLHFLLGPYYPYYGPLSLSRDHVAGITARLLQLGLSKKSNGGRPHETKKLPRTSQLPHHPLLLGPSHD